MADLMNILNKLYADTVTKRVMREPVTMSARPKDWSDADEKRFKAWYADVAKQQGLDPNPDDPEHHYNYRMAFKAGAEPGADGHWPSTYKDATHPNRYVEGVDTITGEKQE